MESVFQLWLFIACLEIILFINCKKLTQIIDKTIFQKGIEYLECRIHFIFLTSNTTV